MNADDEIHFLREGWRLLGGDVQAERSRAAGPSRTLRSATTSRCSSSGRPTVPVDHGSHTEPTDEAARKRPRMHGHHQTPWTRPIRIARTGSLWRVEFGEAIAQQPDPPREHADDESLLADLERIECWPMDVEETRRIRAAMIVEFVTAMAHDQHYRDGFLIEPYASRLAAKSRPGDSTAQHLLVDAEAWASAVRTVRAGGEGGGIDGPK